MITMHAIAPSTRHVSAIFSDGEEVFPLPRGATLADLASHLDDLATLHPGAALEINIHCEKPARLAAVRIGSAAPF